MSKKDVQKEKINVIRNNLKYKRYRLAKELIDDYVFSYGSDCYVELELARYYHLISNFKEAKRILNNLVNDNSKNIGYVLYELGKVYESKNEYEKAIEIYKEIEYTNHKDKNYSYFSIGVLYEKLELYPEAIEYFEKIITSHDTFLESSKFHLARTYFYSKEYEKAKELFLQIIPHNNEKLTKLVLYYEAKIELYLGNNDKYEKKIEYLSTRYPDFQPGISEKVRILLSKKRFRECDIYFKKIKPDLLEKDVDCSYELLCAEYYEQKNQFDKSLEIYSKLLDTNSRYVDKSRILIGIAVSYIGLGNIEKGYEYLLKCLDRNDSYHNICLFNLISLEIHKKNYIQAYNYFNMIESENAQKSDLVALNDFTVVFAKILDIPVDKKICQYYRRKQILNYDLELAYDHIYYGHSMEYASNSGGVFSEDIDIRKLLDTIKDELKDENLIRINLFNTYKIYYKNIGVCDKEKLDYLVVITLPFSKDILTMYPSNENLEEEIEKEQKQKVIKRESQIEKFNRRYNIK